MHSRQQVEPSGAERAAAARATQWPRPGVARSAPIAASTPPHEHCYPQILRALVTPFPVFRIRVRRYTFYILPHEALTSRATPLCAPSLCALVVYSVRSVYLHLDSIKCGRNEVGAIFMKHPPERETSAAREVTETGPTLHPTPSPVIIDHRSIGVCSVFSKL